MDNQSVNLGKTQSVCPVCLQRISAQKVKYGDKVYLEKTCPKHGFFKTLIWNGYPDYELWGLKRAEASPGPSLTQTDQGCPFDCGICPAHRRRTCCVLLEISQRCNLRCPLCFASAGQSQEADPSLEQIGAWFHTLMAQGGPFNIQLSGGEPTMRDDIPEIISLGKEKGFSFFQLNTNGLRLARQQDYAKLLQEAGLNCVFLQFDGLRDETYVALRGRQLLAEKLLAIKNCAAAGLGMVLVPTLVPGVNVGEIGAIINFALENMPAVRGVHFQPVSYFGRYQEQAAERLTIPDVLRQIEQQTMRRMKIEDFKPGTAENPYCSFNAIFFLQENGILKSLHKQASCCCGSPAGKEEDVSAQAREFVARQWSQSQSNENCGCVAKPDSLDAFLARLSKYKLAVSGMAFQDVWNLDLDRLQDCYIHVISPDRRIIPFCSYNLSSSCGQTLYRGRK